MVIHIRTVFLSSLVVCVKAGPRKLDRRDTEEVEATEGVPALGPRTAMMDITGCAMRCAFMATRFVSTC